MSYSKIEQKVWELAEGVAQEQGCYLYDVEYVKEGGVWFLRILVDKEEGGISLDECEAINRVIGDILDKEEPIDRNYYLEVSSPGVERKLKTKEHFDRYLGEVIDIGLYRAIDGAKLITGVLKGYDGEVIKIEIDDKMLEINKKDTTVVHLHFDF